jgi:hypothetical protein
MLRYFKLNGWSPNKEHTIDNQGEIPSEVAKSRQMENLRMLEEDSIKSPKRPSESYCSLFPPKTHGLPL